MAPLVVGNTTVRLATTAAAQSPQIEARMRRELEQLEQNQTRLSVRLAGPFATSAPEDVVQRDRDRLEEASRRAALLRSALQI